MQHAADTIVASRPDAQRVAEQHGHSLGAWQQSELTHPFARCQNPNCVAYCFDSGGRVSLLACVRACPVLPWTRTRAEREARDDGHELGPWCSLTSGGEMTRCMADGCHLVLFADEGSETLKSQYGIGYRCPAPS